MTDRTPASVQRDRIKALHDDAKETRAKADQIGRDRNRAIYDAVTSGVRRGLIAADLGVTEPRVDHMMNQHRKQLEEAA